MDLPDAVGHRAFPATLEALISRNRGSALDAARDTLEREDVVEFVVPDARLLAPIEPGSIRDFRSVVPPRRPQSGGSLYHAIDPRGVVGPDAMVPWPSFTQAVDVEPEVACVIGRWGSDVDPAEAEDLIFGYALMNDWTARDVERHEREAGIGPGRSKDFATSLGPYVVTPDEVSPLRTEVEVRVDGEPWSCSPPAPWTFAELIAEVSRDQEIWPGDVFAGGLPPTHPPRREALWLGALVEIEAGVLGVLRNRLGAS